MIDTPAKPGRKPLGDVAMTAAERKAKQRAQGRDVSITLAQPSVRDLARIKLHADVGDKAAIVLALTYYAAHLSRKHQA